MKIGDVEKLVGLSAKTIRYYESSGLLSVGRRDNSYREYDAEMITALRKIKQMRSLGISVSDIRLWKDGVVEFKELLAKRTRELDDDTKANDRQKRLCESLLAGAPDAADDAVYDEPERELFADRGAAPGDTLVAGIDIGTTSISAQVVSARDGRPIQTYCIAHGADLELPGYPDAFAEDAESLLRRTLSLTDSLIDTYPGIKAIGVTGQMHGIVCLGGDGEILSPLYMWQNGFGLRGENGTSYAGEIERLCGEPVPTGYGIATYYCLKRLGLLPRGTAAVSTIMDLAVMRLTGGTRVRTHPTDAASLGLYDMEKRSFRAGGPEKLGIQTSVLPEVVDGFAAVGTYRGRQTAVGIGDNQAGVFGSLASDGQLLVNIGTSSQISLIAGPEALQYRGAADVRPYFGGKYLLSGAALCGGRAYSLLGDFFIDAAKLAGASVSKSEIYEAMNRAAELPRENPLNISTKFSGTRRDASLRGSITGIGTDNFTARHLVGGVLEGIARELYELYAEFSDAAGQGRDIVVSGNAVRRNPALQRIIGEVFGRTPRTPRHTEEAAYGATLYAAVSAGLVREDEVPALIKYK